MLSADAVAALAAGAPATSPSPRTATALRHCVAPAEYGEHDGSPAQRPGRCVAPADYPTDGTRGIDIYRRLPEILLAEPREGRKRPRGQRWEFDREVMVDGQRRPVRAVVEVPKDGGRPLLITVHTIDKVKTAAAD